MCGCFVFMHFCHLISKCEVLGKEVDLVCQKVFAALLYFSILRIILVGEMHDSELATRDVH